jgi:CheY-like chemotaxis protein
LMGGSIYVETHEGKGSKFVFTILAGKIADMALNADTAAAQDADAAAGSGKLEILVADDTALNRKLVGKMMEKLGHDADMVSDGRQALEAALAKKYDLVLMDVMMPEMDGPTAVQKIRELLGSQAPPMVAMTANAFVGDREALLEMGMDDYISKPFSLNDLKEKLDHWMYKLSGKSVTS